MIYWSHEIGCCIDCDAIEFDRHLTSAAAEVPFKFQSEWESLIRDLTASRLHEILWSNVHPFSEYRTCSMQVVDKSAVLSLLLIVLVTVAIQLLTHLPLDKMAAISQTTSSNAFPWMKCFVFRFKFYRCLVPLMAWGRTGDKLLPEPMLTQFADAYVQH